MNQRTLRSRSLGRLLSAASPQSSVKALDPCTRNSPSPAKHWYWSACLLRLFEYSLTLSLHHERMHFHLWFDSRKTVSSVWLRGNGRDYRLLAKCMFPSSWAHSGMGITGLPGKEEWRDLGLAHRMWVWAAGPLLPGPGKAQHRAPPPASGRRAGTALAATCRMAVGPVCDPEVCPLRPVTWREMSFLCAWAFTLLVVLFVSLNRF